MSVTKYMSDNILKVQIHYTTAAFLHGKSHGFQVAAKSAFNTMTTEQNRMLISYKRKTSNFASLS